MRKLLPILLLVPLLVACPGSQSPAVNQSPTASFTFTVSGLTVTFDASASTDTDGTIVNHAWSFGDGSNGNGANVSHTYAAAGNYTVALTVTDDDGAIGTSQNSVSIVAATGTVQGNLTFAASVDHSNFRAGDLIVRFADTRLGTLDTELASAGLSVQMVRPMALPSTGLYRNSSLDHEQTLALAAALNARPDVVFADLNYTFRLFAEPNDTYYADQWHYPAMNLPAAWDITTGAAGQVVAVVDSGILWREGDAANTHPDFVGKVVPGYDFISTASDALDGDGRDDDPFDPGDSLDPLEFEFSYHGSHVAGTIAAATNNNLGVAGVNWQAQILPVRALSAVAGDMTDIMEGMLWAAGFSVPGVPDNANPARVINMSLGSNQPCPPSIQAVIDLAVQAGAVIVAAAGNDDTNAANVTPASCNGVITVGATGPTGTRASYSNFGTTLDVMAPGGEMTPGNADNGVLSISYDNMTTQEFDYWYQQGTSMAAPHVAGLASLMLALDPDLTPGQVRAALRMSAVPLTAAQCRRTNPAECGAGSADAHAALLLVQGGNIPDPGPGPGPGPGPVPTGPMLVAAMQANAAGGYDIVGSQSSDGVINSYSFESAAGSVFLVAWSDEDGSGDVSPDDLYGEYPSAVTVNPGATLTGLNIVLTQYVEGTSVPGTVRQLEAEQMR